MHDEPFGPPRDPALGSALRSLLDPGDSASFTAGVMGRLPERGSLWRVLAGWARPGIAAALLLATLLGFWLLRSMPAASTLSAQAELTATDRPLDRELLMGVALGGDR